MRLESGNDRLRHQGTKTASIEQPSDIHYKRLENTNKKSSNNSSMDNSSISYSIPPDSIYLLLLCSTLLCYSTLLRTPH